MSIQQSSLQHWQNFKLYMWSNAKVIPEAYVVFKNKFEKLTDLAIIEVRKINHTNHKSILTDLLVEVFVDL